MQVGSNPTTRTHIEGRLMKLQDYAVEELQEEIERRNQVPPTESKPYNWTPVIQLAREACQEVGNEESDVHHYIFEAVMIAVFGEDFFPTWWNPRTP